MNLVEEMFRHVALSAFGRAQFKVRGHTIDFSQPWQRISMAAAVKEKTGVDFPACQSPAEANAKLAGLGIQEPQPSVGEAMVKAFETAVEQTLIQPTLVFGHPVEISPLAKPMAEDPRFVERFEIFIAGMECGDNWSEQNDPAHLLETFRRAWRAEERDTGKFHTLDYDFIEALEYGMPPTTGIGPGVERMAMIFTEQENIDDVIFFPMMRPAVSPLNAAIYEMAGPASAPVEDLALSWEDFQALCNEDVLKPHARNLAVHPRVRHWGAVEATGQIDIEGFLPNSVLRLAGFKVAAEEDAFCTAFVQFLKARFPDCQVTVSPAINS
jgi:lysyl-tRNA synthetase class 2